MSMELAKQSYSTSPEYLIASTKMPVMTATKTASAALKKGSPVTIASNKVGLYTGSGTLYGIASEAAESGAEAVIYLTGEFFADALVLESGADATTVELAFRNIGIFLK